MYKNIKRKVGLSIAMLVCGIPVWAQSTIDLTGRAAAHTNTNIEVVWFADAARTIPLADPTQAPVGTAPVHYYAFYFDVSTSCYSEGAKLTVVPATCPGAIADLTGLATGSNIVWHTVAANPSAATLVVNPSEAAEGIYWAYFYDAATGCYSLASTPVIVSGDCALPVSLLYFTVTKGNSASWLSWATGSEQNNRGFEVERSNDGRNWANIGFVATQAQNGNSNATLNYQYKDEAPLQGVNYYRLKQVDFDDKQEYSPVRQVNFEGSNTIVLMPNPVSNELRIQGLQGKKSISILNSAGQVVIRVVTVTGNTQRIDMSKLTAGLYFVTITDNAGKAETYKIVKD